MIFIANSEGKIVNAKPETVYQGSCGANKIYLICPNLSQSEVTAAFTLPNGVTTDAYYMTHSDNISGLNDDEALAQGWALDIPATATAYFGVVTVQFTWYTAAGAVLASSASTFRVARGVAAELPDTPDEDVYEDILTALANIQSRVDSFGIFLSSDVYADTDTTTIAINTLTTGENIVQVGDCIITNSTFLYRITALDDEDEPTVATVEYLMRLKGDNGSQLRVDDFDANYAPTVGTGASSEELSINPNDVDIGDYILLFWYDASDDDAMYLCACEVKSFDDENLFHWQVTACSKIQATLKVGTVSVETLTPGSEATAEVENVGTPNSAELEFNFGIPQGIQGIQGVSVETAEIDSDGHLIITLDSGESTDTGLVVGANGKGYEVTEKTDDDGNTYLEITETTDTNVVQYVVHADEADEADKAKQIYDADGSTLYTINRTNYDASDAWLLSYSDDEIRYTLPNQLAVGSAASADTLSTYSVGDGGHPVYFEDGVPVVCSYIEEAGSVRIGKQTTVGNFAIAIGYIAHAAYNDAIAIGDTATAKNDYSIAIGSEATAEGAQDIAIGYGANSAGNGDAIGTDASAGSNSVAIGHSANATWAFSVALGYNATCVANYEIRIGTAGYTVYLADSEYNSSDERDKTDFEDYDDDKSLEFISSLRTFSYRANHRLFYEYTDTDDDGNEKPTEYHKKYGLGLYDTEAHAAGTKKGTRRRSGVSAQDVTAKMEEVFGDSDFVHLVNDNLYNRIADGEEIPEGVESMKTVNYTEFIPILISAMKAQQKQIEELKAEIEALKE